MFAFLFPTLIVFGLIGGVHDTTVDILSKDSEPTVVITAESNDG